MIIPTKCPICYSVLFNNFCGIKDTLQKECHNSLNHKLIISLEKHYEEMQYLNVIYHGRRFCWNYFDKQLTFNEDKWQKINLYLNRTIILKESLPWIEPDLQNLRKTLNKLEKIIVFI